LGSWPLGLSYGQFQQVQITRTPDGALELSGLATSFYGATILQSVTPGLIVGSTLKYVRGRPISGPITGDSGEDAMDAAAGTEGNSSRHFDMDLGVMADMERVRVGILVRNVREPSFGEVGGVPIQLKRQARLGISVLPSTGLTLATDLDLDTVDLRDGPRRMLAVGGEDRFGHRWALRGGVRWNLEGIRRPVTTVGASVVVRRNVWLDSHYAYGKPDADRGFGIALRAGY
jgi:hypothetical protein